MKKNQKHSAYTLKLIKLIEGQMTVQVQDLFWARKEYTTAVKDQKLIDMLKQMRLTALETWVRREPYTGIVDAMKRLINYQKKTNKSTSEHTEEIQNLIAGLRTRCGEFWMGKIAMAHILSLENPPVTMTSYKALADDKKKPYQDKYDSLWAVQFLIDQHPKKAFKNFLVNNYAKNQDNKVYGVSVHNIVGRIDDFVDDSKGNNRNKKNQSNKNKNNIEIEEVDDNEDVAAVHITEASTTNQKECTTDDDKPVSPESSTEDVGRYDAIMASILTGNNVVDDVDGVDLNDIPFYDKSLGEFACAIIVTPKQDIYESDESPQFTMRSFNGNDANNTLNNCSLSIVDHTTNNVENKNLSSVTVSDESVVISIVEEDNKKGTTLDHCDNTIVPHEQEEPPLMLLAESDDNREEILLQITKQTPFLLDYSPRVYSGPILDANICIFLNLLSWMNVKEANTIMAKQPTLPMLSSYLYRTGCLSGGGKLPITLICNFLQMDCRYGYVTDQYPQHYTWLRKLPQVGKQKKKQGKNNYTQQSCSMPMFLSLHAVTPVRITFRDYLSNSPNLKPKPFLRYPGEPTDSPRHPPMKLIVCGFPFV